MGSPGGLLDPTERLLVRLSRVRPEPPADAGDLAGVDVERLLAVATQFGNFSLVGRRLLRGAGLDPAVRGRVERNLEHLNLRERLALADVREVARALAAKGEPLLLLKGGAYGLFIYPERGQRTFRDIDFLVRPGALGTAVEVLRGLGYEVACAIDGAVDLRRGMGSGFGLAIEAHTALVHNHDYPFYRAALAFDEERLLARGEPRDLRGVPVLVLRAADELLYSVLHFFFHHALEGIKYHSDLNALFTDPARPLDLEEAIEVARSARAEWAVGLALLVHERLFGAGAVPPALLQALAPRGVRLALLGAFLPPLGRVPLAGPNVARHPVKVLVAPGLVAPVRLGLRWLFPGRRFLTSYYGVEAGTWRVAYHLRYPAEILRKGLGRPAARA